MLLRVEGVGGHAWVTRRTDGTGGGSERDEK